MKISPLLSVLLATLLTSAGSSLATTVAILSPSDGATVSGNVTINGTSSLTTVGNVGIAVDGSATYSAATGKSPWSFSWNTTALANGSHSVTVRARTGVADPSPGQQTITVNVQNGSPDGLALGFNTGGTRINVASGGAILSALSATGGTAPYSWALSTGSLPPGILLNGNGTFSGSSTTPGVHTFSLSATDSLGVSATQSFTVTVNAASLAGTVQAVTINGTVTGRPVTFSLYLPPGYNAGTARYPVVYHLHGIGGTHNGDQTNFVPKSHEAAVAAGLIEPCIIVFPDGYSDSFWADAVNAVKPAETNVMQEIIPHIDSNFRTQAGRNRRVIEGFSMGGFGAGKFATKFPDSFVACVIYDGAMLNWSQIMSRHAEQSHTVFNDSEDTYNLYSPYYWLAQNAVALRSAMPFRDSVGQLRTENTAWRSALLTRLITPEYVETGRDHDVGQLLDAQGANSWEFIARAFAAAPPTGTVSFGAPIYTVGESGGQAVITVTRTSGSTGAIGVDYSAENGTATVNSDFTSSSGTLSWTDGDSADKTFVVPIADDDAHEQDETVALTLGNATGGASIGTSQATLTITDDDPDLSLAVAGGSTGITGRNGSALNATLTATGGTSPYTWALVGGTLPDGVLLGTGGTLEGTPSVTGTFNVTVQATDANGKSDTQTFSITIGDPVNLPPVLSWVPDLRATPGAAVPAQSFRVSDSETPAASLVVTATSSNQTLLKDSRISLGSTGADRTIQLVPEAGQSGLATITLTVTDGSGKTFARAFTLTVAATVSGNAAPMIGGIPNQVVVQNTPTLTFTVGDAETSFTSLVVTAVSSNPALVPNAEANLVLAGTNAQRTLVVKPLANQTGRSVVTLSVTDGTLVSSTAFVVDVAGSGTPPVITGPVGPQILAPGQTPSARTFTLSDAETPADNLSLMVTSSNPLLVPVANITLAGNGTTRSILATPAAGQEGVSVIGITATDEQSMNSRAEFLISVFDDASPNNAVPQPRGLFVLDSSAGTQINGVSMRDANIRDLPFVDGYLLRVEWSQLEPTDGTFDFTIIDNIFAKLPAGQKLSLLLASGSLPAWLNGLPGITTYTAGSPSVTRPYPWDPVAQERFRLLLVALANHVVDGVPLRDHPRFAAINPWIPGLKSGIRDPDEIKIRNMTGYSRTNMESAVLTHLANVTDNFPKIPVQIGFWTYTDSTSDPAAWEELRQLILAQHDGVTRPRVGFWMENLAANRPAPGVDPWAGLPTTTFTAPLYLTQDDTFIGYQMLGSWSRPFNSAHVDNNLNGTPGDGIDYGFNSFQCRYYEVYQADVDFADYSGNFQRWHDFFNALPDHPSSDKDADGLPLGWEQLYGLDPGSANNATDDTDQDGLGLLLEYAFNQSPHATSVSGLPTPDTEFDAASNLTYLLFRYLRRSDDTKLAYTVQVSSDLITWNSGPAYTQELSATPTGDGATNLVSVRILPALDGANARRFARVLVTRP